MYCKHCGREIGDGQRFCSYCGARQQENGPDQVPPQPDGTTATQTGNYHYDAPPPSGGAPVVGGNALLTIFAIVCAVVLKRTRGGLHLRAVGENPATADAAGINVERSKYMATCIGSMIAGLGGLYYVMDYACGVWSNDGFGDRGWLAIALVIFAIWRPNLAIFGSILFGFLYIVYLFIPGLDLSKQELFKMLPYVVTILVLIVTSMRKKKENQGPDALGLAYFREER